MYRFQVWAASALLLILTGVTPVASGCQSRARPVPDEVSLEGKSNPEILYQAILHTFERREIPVDIASDKFLVVTSDYQFLRERLRRRFTARVIRLPGGASALRVRAKYQRKHGSGSDLVWKTIEGDVVSQKASEAELELARDIEKTFRDWKHR